MGGGVGTMYLNISLIPNVWVKCVLRYLKSKTHSQKFSNRFSSCKYLKLRREAWEEKREMEKREGKKRGKVGRERGRKREGRKLSSTEILPGIVRAKESWHSLLFFSVITTDLYFKLGTSILFPLNRITKICFQENFKTSPKFKSPLDRS